MTVPPPQPAYGQPTAAPNNTLGLIAMILGIASIPLSCCFGAGILFGAAGAVLGYMGKQKAATGEATNGSQAQTGFITGIIGAALGLLWVVFGFILNVGMIPFS